MALDGPLELRTRYWNDPESRAAFLSFLWTIHGLDLGAWDEAGYWDDAYTPFSYFADGRVVASVCVYLLDVVLAGRRAQLVQLSGVGTLPEARRLGLSRELTEIGLDWARGRHEGVFLFADGGAVPYYLRCGFRPIEECVEVAPVERTGRRAGAVPLDPGDPGHRDRLYDRAASRAPVSERFGVLSPKLVLFHAMHGLRDAAVDIPDLDCAVLCDRTGTTLRVYDVIAAHVPPLAAWYPYVADPAVCEVEFRFHADRMGVDGSELRPLTGHHPFVRGPFPFARPIFPHTARA